jgi:hypothetical protein
VGDRRIQPQGGGGGIPIVSDVIDAGGDLISSASDVLASVDDTVNEVVPGGWATVASIAVPVAAPYVQAAQAAVALDKGASLEDVAKNYAISQVAGQVGGGVGAETGSSLAGNVAGGTAGGLLSGKSLEQSLQGGLTTGAISQVTPSGLLSSGGTSGTTATQDYVPELNIGQGTTGATNMADITDYFNTGESVSGNYGDPNALQNSFYGYGGLGTENPTSGFGSTPMTQAQIDATMQTYGGNSSLDAATQALVKKALAAGGTAAQGAMNFLSSTFGGTSGANLLQGGLQTAGGLMQTQASKDAALKAQQDLLAATGSATAGSQFRPVGVTTRFGTSQFNINPATGQLESAGYTAAPEITSAQNKLLGLGASYLAQTPEEVAQQYLSKQYELLDPSRQRQLASIRNQAFQTGRGGLSVGSTGLRPSGAQGLMGANPEMEAYYNALAQQDAQLAAGAQQAGQQQVLYGAGLFGQAGNLESMAQQPFTLGTGLGTSISGAGANAGRLGLTGASLAAGYGTSPQATTSPGAYILGGLGSPTSTLGTGLANWLTSTAPTTGGITSQGMNAPTVDAYGNYVPLGYANY